jgi:DNA mismatch endonuclease, patch repair protein
MSRLPRRDNPGEVALRHALYARGLRYRVSYPVPGAPRRSIDIALTRRKVAVFLDGCYWHGCGIHGTQPKSNSEWWIEKFRANSQRDGDTDRLLQERGWTVVRIWEHEDLESAVNRVLDEYSRPMDTGGLR